MIIAGIDLSGPANTKDTTLIAYHIPETGKPLFFKSIPEATDRELFQFFYSIPKKEEIFLGIDAPLSYNPGGGDRQGDSALRKHIIQAGMHPGSVMTPTMTRMAYLTLRGISLTRMLLMLDRNNLKIAETHPGAAMVLRGAPLKEVINMKKRAVSRHKLISFLERQGLTDLETYITHPDDHTVAACSCALAALHWSMNRSVWVFPEEPPCHPHKIIC